MTYQEAKTYLILKYGSISNAIDVYVVARQTGQGDDYEIMHKYFRRHMDRYYDMADVIRLFDIKIR